MIFNNEDEFKRLMFDDSINYVYDILEKFEQKILSGIKNFNITVNFLFCFNVLVTKLASDACDSNLIQKFKFKVDKILNFFKILPSLKIDENIKEFSSFKFDISYFLNLNSLELENVNIDNILNFDGLIPQLKSLKLCKCLSAKPIEELFINKSWPLLKYLYISKTSFVKDFSFIPVSVKHLELKWNNIESFKFSSQTPKSFHITYLDLSYNKIKKIPLFNENELINNSLKVLKLKGNLIKSIKNIENFVWLEVLDLSSNFLYNKNELFNHLSLCKNLIVLDLNENPIQVIKNFDSILINRFPELKSLNNVILCENLHFDENGLPITKINTFEANGLIQEPVVKTVNKSINDLTQSNKVKKSDKVAILLQNSNDFDNQITNDKLCQKNVLDKSLTGSSLGLNINFPNLKEIIAEQKKSLEQKLLRSKDQSSVSSSYSNLNSFKTNEESKVSSNLNDENSITSDKKENINFKDENESKENSITDNEQNVQEQSFASENLWINEEIVDDDNIFLIERCENENQETENIFLIVKNSLIYEKECITGKILTTFDLKILCNLETREEDDLIITLIFDSKIISKKKVKYKFDSKDQIDNFRLIVEPYLEKYKEDQLNLKTKFECLKCGLKNFNQKVCRNCKSIALIETYKEDIRESNLETIVNDSCVIRKSSFKEEFLNQVNLLNPLSDSQTNLEKKSETSNKEDLSEVDSDLENQNFIDDYISSKLPSYNLDQFKTLDHELELYLQVKVFLNNETIEQVFDCDFSINDTSEMLNGKIVVTNFSLHLISLKTLTDDSENEKNFSKINTFIYNKIKSFKMEMDEYFEQGVWLIIEKLCGKKKKKKHLTETQNFFLIIKDQELVNLFTNYLAINFVEKEINFKLKQNRYNSSEFPGKLDTEEKINFSQFIKSLTAIEENKISKSNNDDLLCLLFGKKEELVLAKCEIIANELKFKNICSNDLKNLVNAKLESNCEELHLYFHNEIDNTNTEWLIISYSVNSMVKIIDLIRSSWQEIYALTLQITLNKN